MYQLRIFRSLRLIHKSLIYVKTPEEENTYGVYYDFINFRFPMDTKITIKTYEKNLLDNKKSLMNIIKGYQMTKEQKERILMVRSHLDFIQELITTLDEKLDKIL